MTTPADLPFPGGRQGLPSEPADVMSRGMIAPSGSSDMHHFTSDVDVLNRMLDSAIAQMSFASVPATAWPAPEASLPTMPSAPVAPPVPSTGAPAAGGLQVPLVESFSESLIHDLASHFMGSPAAAPATPPPMVATDIAAPASAPVAQPPRAPAVDSAPPQSAALPGATTFDVDAVRRDFPILNQQVNGRPLIWLDNAATTQKPRSVIDRLVHFYENENSNVHRGAHTLAARSTEAYENAREAVRRFLGAGSANEIVFARGTTEAINLVAQTWGRTNVRQGDEIVLTTLEHHSNIVPWQFLAKEVGARIRVVPITDRGELMLDDYERLLSPRTRLVAFTHVSNALGTVVPVRTMVDMAHRHGALTLVDGAQAVLHFPVNVRALDADFYVFSGHKLIGPTGIGALYAKSALLEAMPPWQGGGSMIDRVTFETTTFSAVPAKFEAGTGNIADAAGLAAAIEYLERIGLEHAASYERGLMAYATSELSKIPGLRQIGTAEEKAGAMSFVVDWMRPEDMGRYLDSQGIAVRAGHHCAQPTLRRYGLSSSVRPSLAFYNTRSEIDALVDAIRNSRTI